MWNIIFYILQEKRQKQYLTRIQNILEEHKKRQKVSYMSLNSSAPEHNAMKKKKHTNDASGNRKILCWKLCTNLRRASFIKTKCIIILCGILHGNEYKISFLYY